MEIGRNKVRDKLVHAISVLLQHGIAIPREDTRKQVAMMAIADKIVTALDSEELSFLVNTNEDLFNKAVAEYDETVERLK